MKILITGDKGYIGSVLSLYLHNNGYEVYGIDTGFYENNTLTKPFTNYKSFKKDIRNLEKKDIDNFDAVIHLAAISNDPLGEIKENITNQINRDATVRIAELSKSNNVKRFIFFSSQSMYGISKTSNELDEYDSEKNPITAYARTKYEAEKMIIKLANDNFCVTCLRPSTVFGVSPRLRTDIVYNNLISSAFLYNKIEIKSDGSPIRPVIHVLDVCNSVLALLKSSNKLINKKSYNVGIVDGNYTVKTMAQTIKKLVSGSSLFFSGEHGIDSRTYSVSFKRILKDFDGLYTPEWDLTKGGIELINFFKKINYVIEDFEGIKTNRLNMLNYLMENNKIDDDFYWQ